MNHPLDRTIWTALTTRQAHLAQERDGIRRFPSPFAPFAATADGTAASFAQLAGLVPEGEPIVLQQAAMIEPPPGLALIHHAETVQMVARQVPKPGTGPEVTVLGPGDAPAMLALAQLTKPGPFAQRTHELGRFVGIRYKRQLVAMAGERLKAEAFTEISGVCTHPDHRGRGYAALLMQHIAQNILERGETPFLHAFTDNAGAVALYERLGFVTRWKPILMVFQRC